MNKRFILSVVVGICTTLILVGCAVGLLTPTQSFQGKDSLVLKSPRPDILDIIAEVGKSMGYHVSNFDKEANTISLSSGFGGIGTALIAAIKEATLTITSKEGGRRLDIDILVMGNLGKGGQEEAIRIVNNFKTKLLERIGEK